MLPATAHLRKSPLLLAFAILLDSISILYARLRSIARHDVKKNNQPEGGYARPELVAAAFLVQNLKILGLACKAVFGLRERPSPNIRCVLGKRTPNLLAQVKVLLDKRRHEPIEKP